jgi:hypothetical protein
MSGEGAPESIRFLYIVPIGESSILYAALSIFVPLTPPFAGEWSEI